MKRLYAVFIIIALLFLGAFSYWLSGKQPVNAADKSEKIFVVQQQENVRDIASSLKRQGLIRSTLVFFFIVKEMGLDGKIQAGDFRLSPSMDEVQIAQSLTHGSMDVWVIIPEGKRATEIAEILSQKIPLYQPSWADRLASQEGYLFPDTYLFPVATSIDQIVTTMENNFEDKYNQASKNTATKLTRTQVVILASIVEREGKSSTDMQKIASVLENRLQLGMALQTDATIQYAVGMKGHWWPTITPTNLTIASTYNTYKNTGLPPTPISNPGLVALTAVFHPAMTDYLYYFTDGHGITHFAKTLDEQNTNINTFGE